MIERSAGRAFRAGDQAAWNDRRDMPYIQPSITVCGVAVGSVAAPRVRNIGTKCSTVGCAYGIPGARSR